MIKNENLSIKGKHNKPIMMDFSYVSNKTRKPIVIFCHGYKGFKDWGAWNLVAEMFAKAGFFFVKFNFSHNGGTKEQPIDFPDLEAFGNNTFIIELDDLENVLDLITASGFKHKNEVDSTKITLIGHSRGGGIATIKATEDHRVNKLITWASVCDYKNRFPKGETLKQWKEDGVMFVENGRTKQQMPHYFQFYTSFIDNENRLTIKKAVKNIKVPHLIIHGTKDPTVSVKEAKEIHSWNDKSELFLVEDANHVFGAKHPWETEILPHHLLEIVEKSMQFAIL